MGEAKNQPIWIEDSDLPERPPLKESIEADVVIVGAGIAGLSTAYVLAREGKSVIVLDDGEIAGGMSSMTTAHLVTALDDRYFELERLLGRDAAHYAAESHAAAIDMVESVCAREGIECGFERLDGYLFLQEGEKEEVLDKELEAARRAGVAGVQKLAKVPGLSFDTGPCLRFPRQGQIHPVKYLAGLAEAIERHGGRIFCNTHVDEVDSKKGVLVDELTVSAPSIVVATNTPFNDLVTMHTKQAPYMTYVVAARVPRGSIPRVLLWDTGDPYHYIRLADIDGVAEEVLVVGGEDHKTGQADDGAQRFIRLESWARERFPTMKEVSFTWSGQVMEPIDSLAFIGPNPGSDANVFIVTGDSGNGMTHGSLAGILLTDLIQGRPNRWAKIYDPGRHTIGSAGTFAKETLNMAAQYADWVSPGDVKTEMAIEKDAGAVVRDGVKKVAVYRDEKGQLHRMSAVCTHLGCIVGWNATEKTWDCPCHGSRFDKLGKPLVGPANTPLARLDSHEEAAD